MKEFIWITIQQVIVFHDSQIHEYGGAYGIRDRTLLESALDKPKNLFHYGSPFVYDIAASYAYGIIKNHPFVDGNKRTGMVTAGIFLLLNKYSLEVPEPELVLTAVALADGTLNEKGFSHWLQKNTQKL